MLIIPLVSHTSNISKPNLVIGISFISFAVVKIFENHLQFSFHFSEYFTEIEEHDVRTEELKLNKFKFIS